MSTIWYKIRYWCCRKDKVVIGGRIHWNTIRQNEYWIVKSYFTFNVRKKQTHTKKQHSTKHPMPKLSHSSSGEVCLPSQNHLCLILIKYKSAWQCFVGVAWLANLDLSRWLPCCLTHKHHLGWLLLDTSSVVIVSSRNTEVRDSEQGVNLYVLAGHENSYWDSWRHAKAPHGSCKPCEVHNFVVEFCLLFSVSMCHLSRILIELISMILQFYFLKSERGEDHNILIVDVSGLQAMTISQSTDKHLIVLVMQMFPATHRRVVKWLWHHHHPLVSTHWVMTQYHYSWNCHIMPPASSISYECPAQQN